MIDTRFSWAVLCMVLIGGVFPFLPAFLEPIFIATAVRSIENIQALMLFCIFVFTLIYMKPWTLPNGKKQFWFWAACWWLLLCGRSISWGRDYFPDVPKPYFRAISVVLIGSVVFMLFSKHLRQEIVHKFKTFSLPLWPSILVIVTLAIVDWVEHLRGLYSLVLFDTRYQDFVEELYEFPFILGLFLVAWAVMYKDYVVVKKEQKNWLNVEPEYLKSGQSRN